MNNYSSWHRSKFSQESIPSGLPRSGSQAMYQGGFGAGGNGGLFPPSSQPRGPADTYLLNAPSQQQPIYMGSQNPPGYGGGMPMRATNPFDRSGPLSKQPSPLQHRLGLQLASTQVASTAAGASLLHSAKARPQPTGPPHATTPNAHTGALPLTLSSHHRHAASNHGQTTTTLSAGAGSKGASPLPSHGQASLAPLVRPATHLPPASALLSPAGLGQGSEDAALPTQGQGTDPLLLEGTLPLAAAGTQPDEATAAAGQGNNNTVALHQLQLDASTILQRLSELQGLYSLLQSSSSSLQEALTARLSAQEAQLTALLEAQTATRGAPPRPPCTEMALQTSPSLLPRPPHVARRDAATECSPEERGRKVAGMQTSPVPEPLRKSREVQVSPPLPPPKPAVRAAACSPFPLAAVQHAGSPDAGVPLSASGAGGPRKPSPRLAALLGTATKRKTAGGWTSGAGRASTAAGPASQAQRPPLATAVKPPEARLLFPDAPGMPLTQIFEPAQVPAPVLVPVVRGDALGLAAATAAHPLPAAEVVAPCAPAAAGVVAATVTTPAPTAPRVLTRSQAQRLLEEDAIQQQIQEELEKHRREKRERQAARKRRAAEAQAGPGKENKRPRVEEGQAKAGEGSKQEEGQRMVALPPATGPVAYKGAIPASPLTTGGGGKSSAAAALAAPAPVPGPPLPLPLKRSRLATLTQMLRDDSP